MAERNQEFRCKVCHETFPTVMKNAEHQKLHSTSRNFLFSCSWVTCFHQFHSFNGLKAHIESFHCDVALSGSVSLFLFKCPIASCSAEISTRKSLCYHFVDHVMGGEKMQCPLFEVCGSDWRYGGVVAGEDIDVNKQETAERNKKEAGKLRRHLGQYHSGWKEDGSQPPLCFASKDETTPDLHGNSAECEEPMETDPQGGNTFSHGSSNQFSDSSAGVSFNANSFTKYIARMYLMLEAQLFLPESSVQVISEVLTTVSEMVQDQMRCLLSEELKNLGVPQADITSVFNRVFTSDAFYNAHHKEAPGPVFTSDHHRRSYYRDNFSYVEPNEIPIDTDYIGGEKLYYIPIQQTLEMLLKDPFIEEQVVASFERFQSFESNVYSDYYTGEICASRPHHKQERIDLIFFQDGFTPNPNVLGSSKEKYKLVATYFSVGNLLPHIRTKVSSIHLAMLFYQRLLKDPNYGHDVCLKPLIDELKILAKEGILFKEKKIPVVAQFFVCDNLGAHELGGFIESFSGEYFCRFCEVRREEFKQDPCIKKPLRTAEAYEEALLELPEFIAHNPLKKTHRGVARASEINKLPDRHVCDSCLPPCVGHDLFENGVVDVDFAGIIKHFVQEKWFSYETLNRRIQDFKYQGSDCGNKPAAVKTTGTKLGGHAVQNWTLLRLFPLIIEGLIKNTEDPYWTLYLQLKIIVEIVCAPKLTEEKCQELDKRVNDYLIARNILENPPKPKHHFFSHYASFIKLFGVLMNLWTLRAESKHSFFKRLARICQNYKNLIWTLSTRHQMFLAFLCSGSVFKAGLSDAKSSNMSLFKEDLKLFIEIHHLLHSQYFHSVVFNEIQYKIGNHVLLSTFDYISEECYVGHIQAIVWHKNSLLFLVDKIKVTKCSDFGIFQLEESDKMSLTCIEESSLIDPIPYPVYDFQDKLCVSLKHILV